MNYLVQLIKTVQLLYTKIKDIYSLKNIFKVYIDNYQNELTYKKFQETPNFKIYNWTCILISYKYSYVI